MNIAKTPLEFIFSVLVFLSVTIPDLSESAKILCIFPTPSYSHQLPLLEVSYALAARGHKMTILTTDPSKEPIKNVKEYDISSSYKDWEEMQKYGPITLQKRSSAFDTLPQMCVVGRIVADFLTNKPQFKDLIKDVNGTKYDLILYESLMYSSFLGITELVGKPPIVGLMTIHPFSFTDLPMGNPIIPSSIPQVMLPHTDRMTFYERYYNLYLEVYGRYILETCLMPLHDEYLRKIFGNLPYTAKQLEYNKSLLIVSTDLTTGYPKPHQPNTIFVGPLHLKKPKPLPQELQKWMDESEGVIYFSLGSNMKGTSVPPEVRDMFIQAFRQFPKMRVLWKWEADTDLPGRPDNVLARKWLPQQSILAHPKMRLFISQGGLQSLQEAINSTVPILGIPIFGDQDYNMKKLLREGGGRALEFNEISYDTVYKGIKEMLTNSSYKENMVRLSKISSDTPLPAMDTAIWWIEYVIRHKGAPHLRPAVLDLSWYQLYMLDVLGLVASVPLAIVFLLYIFIKKFILSQKKSDKKLKTK